MKLEMSPILGKRLALVQEIRTLHTPNTETISSNVSISYDSAAFDSGGPLQVSYPNYIYSFGSYAQKGFVEIGLPENKDGFASGHLIGHQDLFDTISPSDETRSSSQTSYLELGLQQTDLVVYTHTLVKRILFDSKKKATGVLVEAGGVLFSISAGKEVISSCGTFQSPHLLMLSGIGPAKTLEHHGIEVIAHIPGVGQNVWDNIIFGPSYEVNLETDAVIENPEYAGEVVQQYLDQRAGPLKNAASDYNGYGKILDQPWGNISRAARSKLAEVFTSDWPEAE